MIIVTAATKWEAVPLEKTLKRFPDIRLLRTGMGPVNAKQAIEQLKLNSSVMTVISSGLAGALQPGVRRGDIVADFREAPLELVQSARAAAEQLKMPLHLGAFLSADHVLSPDEKRDLGVKNRALAVDMESVALREWTKAAGGTFMAVRAVLDELDDDLPEDAPGEGAAEVLRFAAKHWKKIPTLAALDLRQRRAMKRLTAFLEEWFKLIG
jgi:nucleoside phosphorylase